MFMKMHKQIMSVLALILILVSGIFHTAAAESRKIRVVGSWSSLTMFKNFEKPFWVDTIPQEMGFTTSVTSLSQVKLKGPAVLRGMDMGLFDVVYTVAVT